MHDQGGAFISGNRPKTKKVLKEAYTAGKEIILDSTSAFGPAFYGSAEDLKEGDNFVVVGPDPYRKRNWYASVERKNGKIKVS